MNEAVDDVRSAEAKQMLRDCYEPVSTKPRWCFLKRWAEILKGILFQTGNIVKHAEEAEEDAK